MILRAFGLAWLTLLALWAVPAAAHPHVWVTVRAELVYAPGGKVAAVRHRWSFDESYSAYAVQGLDTNKDGIYSREELADLAKVNAEALAEFGYFTVVKVDGKRLELGAASDPWLDYDKTTLTLNFTVPLKEPVQAKRTLFLDVYDPTFFVDFSYAETDPVTLSGAPQGCVASVTRPKKPDQATAKLSEDYFANANMGLQFASKVLVACP